MKLHLETPALPAPQRRSRSGPRRRRALPENVGVL